MANQEQQNEEQGEWKPAVTGAVKDPEQDGRLKQNRESGKTLGTTEHTAQAPHVKGKDEGGGDEEEDEAEPEDEA